MSVTVTLSKSITVGGEPVSTVDLREPTIKDVRDLGYPFIVVQGKSSGGMEVSPDIVIRYAARLSANPPSAFDAISLGDLSKLQTAVMSFFGEEAATSQAS